MRFKEPITLSLKVVTPLFIGSGEEARPLSYVVDRRVIHVLDPDRFLEGLTETQREHYLAWIEPLLDQLADFNARIEEAGRDYKLRGQLRRQRREIEAKLSLEVFLQDRLRVNPVRFVQEAGCRAYSVPYRVRPDHNGFRTHIKDAHYRPYIPGTGIKGGLRTSLLYALLEEEPEPLMEKLEGFVELYKSGVSPGKKMEEELVRGKKDAKFDFLKLIQVSDSTPLEPDSLYVESVQSMGTGRYTRTAIETLTEGSEAEFRIAVAEVSGEKESQGITELKLEKLNSWLSVPRLFEACYLRSRDILEEEAAYFANEPTIMEQISWLREQNQPSSPLLRLGWGQGFLSTTMGIQVKKHDEKLYEEAIREPVSFMRRWRTQEGNFPKTRRVIIDRGKKPISLLGWTKISFQKTKTSPSEKEMAQKMKQPKAKFDRF